MMQNREGPRATTEMMPFEGHRSCAAWSQIEIRGGSLAGDWIVSAQGGERLEPASRLISPDPTRRSSGAGMSHIPFRDHRNQAQVRKDEEIGESLAKLGNRITARQVMGEG